MPLGRDNKTPKEAKEDSIKAILKALTRNPAGMRFNKIKSETQFHQSTVSARLKELINSKFVEYDPINRVYRISRSGFNDLETRELLEIIEKSSRMILGSKGGGSLNPIEDLILKTSVGYSFPAIKPASLGYLKRILHMFFLLHVLHDLARSHVIDARVLTGEKPLSGLVESLKGNLGDKNQVLAFKIDLGKVAELLSVDYLSELVRIAKLEDEIGLQVLGGNVIKYYDLWKKYAEQERVLEFIEEQGMASILEVSELLGVDEKMVESILDELLVHVPDGMKIFDETGKLMKSVNFSYNDMEVDVSGGSVVKLRVKTSTPLLEKSITKDGVYYSTLNESKT